MDLMHRDKHYAQVSIVTGILQSYGTKEDKMTCHVQLAHFEKDQDVIVKVHLLFPYAGHDHGFLWRAEIGDQVVMALFGEHEYYAIILGSIADADSWFWKDITEKNEEKSILLRNGWKLTLWDEKDKQELRMLLLPYHIEVSQEKATISIYDDKKETQMIIDAENSIIAFTTKKACTIHCGSSTVHIQDNEIELHADKLTFSASTIAMKADTSLSLEAQSVKINAKAQADITSNGQLKVNANAVTEIKGGIVKLG